MIRFHSGEPHMVDATLAAAASAGDAIVLGAKLLVAHTDIPANELGALSYPGGQSTYKITLAAGDSYAVGDPVTVNPATGETNAAAGTAFGICVGADVNQANGDAEVTATLDN